MTVVELIAKLQTLPPTMPVLVDGYEDGYCDILTDLVSITRVCRRQNVRWWQGLYDDVGSMNEFPPFDALVLSRTTGNYNEKVILAQEVTA